MNDETFVGVVVCSIALGFQFGSFVGWMFFGGSLIVYNLIRMLLRYLDGK